MAEVCITLDNEQRWLPIDFDEVISHPPRPRSGESEYLINDAEFACATSSNCS